MIKLIILVMVLLSIDHAFSQGDAPALLKGQGQASNQVGSFIQFPNNQVTRINSATGLIETGNNNILVNPSFEHATFSTGWTNSAGIFTEETVVEIHGRKAAKLVLSSQTMSLTQSSTLYASQFADGVQGLVSVRVKSDVALKLCSVQAGVVSNSNCVDILANNKWGLYKVPMILGGTSNGISVSSSGAVSGTVYIDDAFVGAQDLKVDGVVAKSQSSTASGALAAGVTFSGSYTTTNSSNGIYSDASGVITVLKKAAFSISFSLTSSTTTTVVPSIKINGSAVSGDNSPAVTSQRASSSYNAILDVGTTISFTNDGAGPAGSSSISLNAITADSGATYSSTNADTDWQSCGHTTSSFTGFGTVTNITTQCKRQGSDLLIRGRFQAGTPTAVEARMNLPLWNGVQLVSVGTSKIPLYELAGDAIRNYPATNYFRSNVLIEPSVSYVTFGSQSSSDHSFTKLNGSALVNANEIVSITARIPIEGWENSNIIIGQFNGLEKCESTLDCTDVLSAYIDTAGNVITENVDWLNGNCTQVANGKRSCSIKTGIFTVTPVCNVTATNAGSAGDSTTMSSAWLRNLSTSTIDYWSMNGTTFTNMAVYVSCKKQGVDYIGKTAKAVASDQNVRTPGVINAVIYSAFVSSTGTLLSEIGDFINGPCTFTAPNIFTCNFNSDAFSSDPVCNLTVLGASGASRSAYIASNPTKSSVQFLTYNTSGPTAVALNTQLTCHGIK